MKEQIYMMLRDAKKKHMTKIQHPLILLLILSKLVTEDKFPHQIKDTDANTYN